jgi:hypothetical protein
MTYIIETYKFHNLQVKNTDNNETIGLFTRFQHPQLEQLVKQLNKYEKQLQPIREICEKYKIPLQDLPDVLEEYIAYDNEEYLEKLKNQH